MRRVAISGASGFVGGVLLRLAVEQGLAVRALTRRPQPMMAGVEWVEGALDRPGALATLVDGADAVIHVAGVINASDLPGFLAGNVVGTAAMVEATSAAGIARFVHVSSLAAREPGLSHYGWSKAEAEAIVRDSALDWVIVRPPAVYGPGDREMLELFRAARRGIVPLPPAGRLSLIEVGDLARLLLDLAIAEAVDAIAYEPDDGVAGGWAHREFARALGRAVGRPMILPLSLPAGMLRMAARIDRRLRGKSAKLTDDRVRYFCHPDWVVSPTARPPVTLWTPRVPTAAGLAATAAWYREQGWL